MPFDLYTEIVEEYNNKGNELSERGKNEEAQKAFKEADGLKPWLARAHVDKGIALFKP